MFPPASNLNLCQSRSTTANRVVSAVGEQNRTSIAMLRSVGVVSALTLFCRLAQQLESTKNPDQFPAKPKVDVQSNRVAIRIIETLLPLRIPYPGAGCILVLERLSPCRRASLSRAFPDASGQHRPEEPELSSPNGIF
jgi:hypothetical protein